MSATLLDPIPIPVIFLLFAVFTLVCYEVAFRVGRWWQHRQPGIQEGPRETLVGAMLALIAFLLAVTMSMASDRFDTRRGIVLQEANAIEAVYLQADYLPSPESAQIQELVREYLPLRIRTGSSATIPADLAKSIELQQQMWAITGSVARSGYLSDLMSSFGDSLTELTNVSETRVTSGLYARVPDTIIVLLLVGSALSLLMVGYGAGLRGERSIFSALILVVALGVVLTLVVDLDRPLDGLITVSQRPLIDVQQRIGLPSAQ